MDRVWVGRFSIAFERRGAGPPLVLLRGGVSERREWRRQLTRSIFERSSTTRSHCSRSSNGSGAHASPGSR